MSAEPPEWHVTAQHAAGDAAVVCYTAKRSTWWPAGMGHAAFLLGTTDRGATWRQLPLTRDVWSYLRYPGFPVWPPEFVTGVEVAAETVTLAFRDEEVVYEPGGESMWSAMRSPRGLWRLRRVRKMRYVISGDDGTEPSPIALELPAGFVPPGERMVEKAAAGAASYIAVDVPLWLWTIPALAVGILIGAGAIVSAISLVVAMAIGLPVTWFWLDRGRQRREAAG